MVLKKIPEIPFPPSWKVHPWKIPQWIVPPAYMHILLGCVCLSAKEGGGRVPTADSITPVILIENYCI